jgi:uncharacterized protein YqgQ
MNLDALEITLISLLVTFFGSIIIVFKSKNWQIGLTNYFLRRLQDREILELNDLRKHRLLVRLDFYKSSDEFKDSVNFVSPIKAEIFFKYISIISNCYYNFIVSVLDKLEQDVIEDDLVILFSKETITLNTEINNAIRQELIKYGGNTKDINIVVNKLHNWRAYYTNMYYRHTEEIIRGGKYTGTLYKVDTIFSNYALGIDILFKNGIDSFNLLNGELDKLIK